MNPRKSHIPPGLLLGMAALLTVCCLVAAVGISYARYRTDAKQGILFQTNQSASVYLGHVVEGSFLCEQSTWVKVEQQRQLSFAISNGQTPDAFAAADQQARVRLIASLGAWSEDRTEPITLMVAGQTYTATAERIIAGTNLHATFGDGWVLRFVDERGNEPVWDLPGGSFSCTEMLLSVTAGAVPDTSLLQLQIISQAK